MKKSFFVVAMWLLDFERSNKKYYLLVNKVYTIGRKDADIVVSDDSSVSRRHGTIEVKVDNENKSCSVVVHDSSKFGTFYVRNSSVNKQDYSRVNNSAILFKGDTIRIGAQHTFCKVECEPLIIVTSMLDQSSQASVKSYVDKLGGEMFATWQPNTTYLIINQVKLTVKVIQALASATSIVKVSFLEKFCEALTVRSELPLPKDFLPPIAEESLDCDVSVLLPNISRKTIFKNRLFVFINKKQYKRSAHSCTLAGGKSTQITDIPNDNLNTLIDSSNTAFILPPSDPSTFLISEDEFCELLQKLSFKKLRFIEEHEIGLAVLFSSVERYCNPECGLKPVNAYTQSLVSSASMSQSQSKALEEDSHSLGTSFVSHVPETLQPSIDRQGESSKKRCFSAFISDDESVGKPVTKSIKLDEEYVAETNEDIAECFDVKKKRLIPRPAPKRKTSDVLTPVDKARKTCSVKEEPVSPSKDQATVQIDCLPDSCIADDSLWSCKANSQPIEEDNLSSTKRIRAEVDDKLSEQRPEAGGNAGQGVLKKAFVPAAVPEHDHIDITKFDPALPFQNLSIIHHVPLVKKRKPVSHNQAMPLSNQTNTKNFKRFAKVAPGYKTAGSQTGVGIEVPRIIGGKDLIKHSNRIDSTPALANVFINSEGIAASAVSKPDTTFAASQDDNPF